MKFIPGTKQEIVSCGDRLHFGLGKQAGGGQSRKRHLSICDSRRPQQGMQITQSTRSLLDIRLLHAYRAPEFVVPRFTLPTQFVEKLSLVLFKDLFIQSLDERIEKHSIAPDQTRLNHRITRDDVLFRNRDAFTQTTHTMTNPETHVPE